MAERKLGADKAASRTAGRFATKSAAPGIPATTAKEQTPARAKSFAASVLTQTAVLKKAGGSLIVTVPARARDALRLSAGQEMLVAVEGHRLVFEVSRPSRPKYSIDELIAKCDPSAPYPDEAREWIDAPAAGRELL